MQRNILIITLITSLTLPHTADAGISQWWDNLSPNTRKAVIVSGTVVAAALIYSLRPRGNSGGNIVSQRSRQRVARRRNLHSGQRTTISTSGGITITTDEISSRFNIGQLGPSGNGSSGTTSTLKDVNVGNGSLTVSGDVTAERVTCGELTWSGGSGATLIDCRIRSLTRVARGDSDKSWIKLVNTEVTEDIHFPAVKDATGKLVGSGTLERDAASSYRRAMNISGPVIRS